MKVNKSSIFASIIHNTQYHSDTVFALQLQCTERAVEKAQRCESKTVLNWIKLFNYTLLLSVETIKRELGGVRNIQ